MKTKLLFLVLTSAWLGIACEADKPRSLSGANGGTGGESGSTDDGSNGDTAGDTDDGDSEPASGSTEDGTDQGPASGDDKGDGCTGMDILFVIDDSGSMGEEQENLKANFPKFIEVLDDYRTPAGTPLEYRVGVTTIGILRNFKQNGADMTSEYGGTELDDGLLLGQDSPPEPNCGLTDPWLEGPAPDVVDTFNCMATVGLSGTVVEMPMAVIQEALGPRLEPGGTNAGFYDPQGDSLLVVVIITDEDDCSIEEGGRMVVSATGASDCDEDKSVGLYPPVETKQFLDNLTGGEDRYVVVTIAAQQQCQSDFGKADTAKRLKELVDLCKDNGFFGDICAGDLWIGLKEALDTMQVACQEMPPVV